MKTKRCCNSFDPLIFLAWGTSRMVEWWSWLTLFPAQKMIKLVNILHWVSGNGSKVYKKLKIIEKNSWTWSKHSAVLLGQGSPWKWEASLLKVANLIWREVGRSPKTRGITKLANSKEKRCESLTSQLAWRYNTGWSNKSAG